MKGYEKVDKPENLSLRENIVLGFTGICIAFAIVFLSILIVN